MRSANGISPKRLFDEGMPTPSPLRPSPSNPRYKNMTNHLENMLSSDYSPCFKLSPPTNRLSSGSLSNTSTSFNSKMDRSSLYELDFISKQGNFTSLLTSPSPTHSEATKVLDLSPLDSKFFPELHREKVLSSDIRLLPPAPINTDQSYKADELSSLSILQDISLSPSLPVPPSGNVRSPENINQKEELVSLSRSSKRSVIRDGNSAKKLKSPMIYVRNATALVDAVPPAQYTSSCHNKSDKNKNISPHTNILPLTSQPSKSISMFDNVSDEVDEMLGTIDMLMTKKTPSVMNKENSGTKIRMFRESKLRIPLSRKL